MLERFRTVPPVIFLVLLAACSYGYSQPAGGPERVSLIDKPFASFVQDEEKTARWLASDFLSYPDKTLADPVTLLQDFSQFEWTANAMRSVYVHVTPGMAADVVDSRDRIRSVMNVPRDQSVSDAIRGYADRARSVSDEDRRLLAERRDVLRVAMVQAGYAMRRYGDSLDREQQREHEPFVPH